MTFRARSRLMFGVAVVATLSCLSACALVLGIDPPTLVEGSAPADATTADAVAEDGTTNTEGGGGDAANDVEVDSGPCVGTERPTELAIFVAPSGADDDNCGSQDTPCKTVQFAINRAKVSFGKVFIAAGPDNKPYEETITLSANLVIEGGWEVVGKEFFRTCEPVARSRVVIQAPPSSDRTVIAEGINGTATLRKLTVRSKDAAASSETLYGIFAAGAQTKVVLEEVSVQVAAGGDGTAGLPGANGLQGDAGCGIGSGADASVNGAGGLGADGGLFTDAGYAVGLGTGGEAGVVGNNGATGTPPSCVKCFTCQAIGCGANAQSDSCGLPGIPGCAGGAGQGGGPGAPGGSSIGIYAVGATVQLLSGEIVAGNGGAGGVGGQGGPGGVGGAGRTGDGGAMCISGCSGLIGGCAVGTHAGDGGTGGSGGFGSAGGQGGGGAGGRSYAVVRVANATLLQDGGTLRGGDAGASLGNGAPGTAGDIFP